MSDDELPGMWAQADLTGGETDAEDWQAMYRQAVAEARHLRRVNLQLREDVKALNEEVNRAVRMGW